MGVVAAKLESFNPGCSVEESLRRASETEADVAGRLGALTERERQGTPATSR